MFRITRRQTKRPRFDKLQWFSEKKHMFIKLIAYFLYSKWKKKNK